ncbi:hypothetical protein B296_00035108 [Ensete ventricosum]|uniref:Uncharacterized protein n=1 Tax=Ensete ventricosum TaxID=4639 RepID=A0A427A2X6_ENSVE|nr:hypothetical protein B296_00035108 [Ensete ventricosum]
MFMAQEPQMTSRQERRKVGEGSSWLLFPHLPRWISCSGTAVPRESNRRWRRTCCAWASRIGLYLEEAHSRGGGGAEPSRRPLEMRLERTENKQGTCVGYALMAGKVSLPVEKGKARVRSAGNDGPTN